MLPPSALQQAIQRLEKTILELVEIKGSLVGAAQLQQQTIKALSDLVALNDPRIDEVLNAAQLVITGPNGDQIFPRKIPLSLGWKAN